MKRNRMNPTASYFRNCFTTCKAIRIYLKRSLAIPSLKTSCVWFVYVFFFIIFLTTKKHYAVLCRNIFFTVHKNVYRLGMLYYCDKHCWESNCAEEA